MIGFFKLKTGALVGGFPVREGMKSRCIPVFQGRADEKGGDRTILRSSAAM